MGYFRADTTYTPFNDPKNSFSGQKKEERAISFFYPAPSCCFVEGGPTAPLVQASNE